jgi:CSLREA domain-containing protein
MKIRTKTFIVLSLVVALILLLDSHVAYAATISVNTTNDELNADGDCSLREAITAANTNTAVDSCPSGDLDPDTIIIDTNGVIVLTTPLPTITDNLTIIGPGEGNLTISGNNSVGIFEVRYPSRSEIFTLEAISLVNGNSDIGGGIKAFNGQFYLNHITISNSYGTLGGGAIYNQNGYMVIESSTFSNNRAGVYGGAIYSLGQLVISNSTIADNYLTDAGVSTYGGGVYVYDNNLGVRNSTFTHNGYICNYLCYGGAIYYYGNGHFMAIKDSTFANNVGSGAAAVQHNSGFVDVWSSTFVNNNSDSNGSYSPGIFLGNGSFRIENSILVNTPTGNGVGSYGGGGNLEFPTRTYFNSSILADPLLGPLRDNGGPTKTFRLGEGSPAIDAVPVDTCDLDLISHMDQRGVARPQGAACDIGSFELRSDEPPTNEPLTIDSPLPNGTVDVSYSVTLGASGGTPPYTWSLASGSLPPGLILDPPTGVISGTPTTAGAFNFTVQVADNSSAIATKEFTLTIQAPPLIIITASPLPTGTIGVPYSVTLEAIGGTPPYVWSLAAGALPPGLSLDSVTGIISGTPTTAGTFGFTVQVTDSSAVVATKQFALAPPPSNGSAGSSYTIPISVPDTPPDASGGTPSCTNYELVSGALPDGLTLDSNTGVISGTPTDGGAYTFTVQCVVSTGQTATKEFIITIENPAPTLTSLDPSSATAGSGDFSLTVNGTNFVGSSTVQWNGSSRTTIFVSATQLTTQISAADIAAEGTASVTVVNPAPNGGTSNELIFNINPANQPPTADAGGPYEVFEGSIVMPDGSGSSDPDGDPLTYNWDMDNDGSFETPGPNPTFSAVGRDGPGIQPIALQVCDPSDLCGVATTVVNIKNVTPTANAGADQSVFRNDVVNLSGTWTDPAESLDNPYAWSWDLTGDGGADRSGSESYGNAVNASTSFATEGTYILKFEVADKDNGSDSDTLVVTVLNRLPDCSAAAPSITSIWPPNHQFVPVNILGVTDPEGDPLVITITSIRQDEPVDTNGDGSFTPDGRGVGTSTAEVRAERAGTKKVPGNGRVYHIGFTADDGHSGSCSADTVLVGVPHDIKDIPIDEGPLYDSTALAP